MQSFSLTTQDRLLTYQVLNSAVPRSTLLIASINIVSSQTKLLGPIHTQYFLTQYFDKKIKRHFSSKIVFSCVNWRYLFLDNYDYCNLVWKYFKMSQQYFEEKIYFYQNVFLFFHLFIEMLCAKMLCVWYGPETMLNKNHFVDKNRKKYCKCKWINFNDNKTFTFSLDSSEIVVQISILLNDLISNNDVDKRPTLKTTNVTTTNVKRNLNLTEQNIVMSKFSHLFNP